MKAISNFIKSNKILFGGFIIAAFIFISYELTMDWPEKFPHADFIYNLFSQLSLAYMGSLIFYIMQVYIPEERNKKITSAILKRKLDFICECMVEPAMCIMNSVLKKELDLENLDRYKFEGLYTEAILKQGSEMVFRNNQEITHKDYAIENIQQINQCVNDIYSALSMSLDIEIIDILENIKESTYNKIFIRVSGLEPGKHENCKKINGDITTVIMTPEDYDEGEKRKEAIMEYYDLYVALNNYKRTLD
ncbi:Uncharacterised protein [[Clostridium] sordellii]|uniref:hypothetical protein n=1 Tax=Paraclostridium sordellii TaxID=1505 RepID=UPI0005E5E662|nr:hypothetical protein [Paeniclostridium sordellii]CEO04845.1 Uncharacterised protein [[Clostridium] sordellii] [Paeniclostridium sordellii]